MSYRYLLWDLDGTLTDSKEGIINCVIHALTQMNYPIPDNTVLQQFIGPPLEQSFETRCQMSDKEVRRAVMLFRSRYHALGQYENHAAPGILELLSKCTEKGFHSALSSSKPQEMCLSICRRFGFSEYLSPIVGSLPDEDLSKTDIIRKTCSLLGLRQEDLNRTLMIGDRSYDVVGAHNCGIDCIGVDFFHYAEKGELENAGALHVCKTVNDLSEFLLNL